MPAGFETPAGASGIRAVIAVMAMNASVLVVGAVSGLDTSMSGEGSRAAVVGEISVAASSAMASTVG